MLKVTANTSSVLQSTRIYVDSQKKKHANEIATKLMLTIYINFIISIILVFVYYYTFFTLFIYYLGTLMFFIIY